MKLKSIVDISSQFYKEPSMLINAPGWSFPLRDCPDVFLLNHETKEYKDEIILKRFSENPQTKAIVIAGLEPMENVIDLRSFIFSARKFFDPGNRPKIIILTTYYMEELPQKKWGGLRSEIIQYGNCIIRCGRYEKTKKKVLGIPLSYNQNLYSYNGYQYS